MNKKFILILAFFFFLLGGLFYFRNNVYYSRGAENRVIIFEIKKGEGTEQIASRLAEKNIISGKVYFYYYLYTSRLLNKIMPGSYMLNGNLNIPEIAHIITNSEAQAVKITFPEGLTGRDMAEILKKNNFDGEEFLRLANDIPENFRIRYGFLSNAKVTSLEGYLFPDTYFFKKEITAENIAKKMLDNFEERMDEQILSEIKNKNKNLNDIIILASIVEKEVPAPADMKIVAGIFENRLAIDMSLQSDASLSYILNDKIDSHTIEQTKIISPYNTYINKGLPPGPIANPGMNAILAAVYPQETDYLYFLTTKTESGQKIYYAKTFEEHIANKKKAGL